MLKHIHTQTDEGVSRKPFLEANASLEAAARSMNSLRASPSSGNKRGTGPQRLGVVSLVASPPLLLHHLPLSAQREVIVKCFNTKPPSRLSLKM